MSGTDASAAQDKGRDSSSRTEAVASDDKIPDAPTALDGPAELSGLGKQTWIGVLKRTFKMWRTFRRTTRPMAVSPR
jgi:hypothetical protein